MSRKLGVYAFMGGVLAAIILGIASPSLGAAKAWLTSLLVVLGLAVGLLNVTGKEAKDFLLMATVIVIMAFAGEAAQLLGGVLYAGKYLSGIFSSLLLFVVPATIITALKSIWALGRD